MSDSLDNPAGFCGIMIDMTITREAYLREWQDRYWEAREVGSTTSEAHEWADDRCEALLDEIEDEE